MIKKKKKTNLRETEKYSFSMLVEIYIPHGGKKARFRATISLTNLFIENKCKQ